MGIEIRPIEPKDIPELHQAVSEFWGSATIVVHLQAYNCDELPGFTAFINNELAGFLHYEIRGKTCEALTLAALTQGQGIGKSLMTTMERFAAEKQCAHLQVTTTNDNILAIGFYQHLGFQIKEVYPGRIALARKIKPSIPMIGENGLSILDEILLEKEL